MKYSFVIPAYKGCYLKQAINSILAQTITDFELIIVNDASPDNLDEIIASYNDNRIRYYKNETNIGKNDLIKSWNHALSYTTGEYVVIASDDDTYTPNYLKQAECLIAMHPECDLIRGRVAKINEKGEMYDYECKFDEYQTCEDFTYCLLRHSYKCAANYMYKRQSFLQKGSFVHFPYAWYSDVATPLNMAQNGVLNMQEVSFYFRVSPEHISADQRVSTLRTKLKAILMFQKWQNNYFQQLTPSLPIMQAQAALRLDIVSVLTHHLQHISLLHCCIWWKYVIKNSIFFQYEKAEAIASRLIYLFR